MNESLWHDFARATAAKGVASTLSLPILHTGRVVGTVNLYAASDGAFGGRHREIADVFGAWAPGAVTNADLSFRTRHQAEGASDKVRMEVAVGMLMEVEGLDAEAARELLRQAARRAGVAPEELAASLLEVYRSRGDD